MLLELMIVLAIIGLHAE
ncbi:prepilin-type N-terminal cleavage/methylation domain-containing protein [Acinetobacter bereziniae]|nr:prepilin-type N-terminal cleavage/methylation domain-containing protein [Acinetobacter bereziniae]